MDGGTRALRAEGDISGATLKRWPGAGPVILVLLAACCALAGCRAAAVQGTSRDTDIEQGVGRVFQSLVPNGSVVEYVRCFGSKSGHRGQCDIGMIAGRPDPVYVYAVTVGGHRFLAQSAGNRHDRWTPPQSFAGSY